MSGIEGMFATLRALERAPEEVDRDVAAMLRTRVRASDAVEVRGGAVAIVPAGRSLAFLTDETADAVARQAEETLARIGGGR